MSKRIPNSLIDAYIESNLVPIVGAGVSMSILNKKGKSVFPSWEGLLKLAADELQKENKKDLGDAIIAVLKVDDYASAADYARKGLKGSLWDGFFRKHFDVDIELVDRASLALPEAVWALGNRIITLNYDRALRWACPDKDGVLEIDNSNKAELAGFIRNRSKKPQVWHLHGRLDNISSLILTRDSYSKLYDSADSAYNTAISILKDLCVSKQLIFIGCSLSDAELLDHLSVEHEVFDGNTGPHYALVHRGDFNEIKEKVSGIPIEVIEFEEYGEPLLDLITEITSVAGSEDYGRSRKKSKGVGISCVVDFESGDSEDVLHGLTMFCSGQNSKEIERVAKRKYIKDLYVVRGVESTLRSLFVSDEALSNQLSEILDIPYIIGSNAKKDLAKIEGKSVSRDSKFNVKLTDDDKKQIEKCNKKIQVALSIEEKLRIVLSDSAPCSGNNRGALSEMTRLYRDLQKDCAENESHLITKSLGIVEPASKFITVIVDRAGGGKTNLLCHLASINSKAEPTLFLGGRINIDSDDSLILVLANALGMNSGVNPFEYIEVVSRLLDKMKVHATIFIDGINENRDIPSLNSALNVLKNTLDRSRFRFVFTCRDIYWTFFEDAKWVSASNIVRGNLYSFSSREQELALDAYLKYFNIEVNLGVMAKERCKHPLLLRFFCEAYSRSTREKVNLGSVPEIRLKPLFDDYWKAKVSGLAGDANKITQSVVEGTLYKLVSYMFESNVASLTTEQIPQITGVSELDSQDSVYLRLLDEDIIIEETPTSDVGVRKVIFVYEEFMEYSAARYLQNIQKDWAVEDLDKYFPELNKKVDDFVNVLGMAEYLCAFNLDNDQVDLAFSLVVNMARSGGKWITIITNIFSKYDLASTMMLAVSIDKLVYLSGRLSPANKDVDLSGIEVILDAIGSSNRTLMNELSILMLYSIILPGVFSFNQLVSSESINKIPCKKESYSYVEENKKRAHKLIKIVAKLFDKYDLNSVQSNYWKSWEGGKEYVGLNDRADLIKKLSYAPIGASRKKLILSLACNGLFDSDVYVRRACALVTKDLQCGHATAIRRISRSQEKDLEVIRLLRDDIV